MKDYKKIENIVQSLFFVQFQDTGETFFAKSTGELAAILECSLSNASKIIKKLDTQKFSLARRAIVKLVDVEVGKILDKIEQQDKHGL